MIEREMKHLGDMLDVIPSKSVHRQKDSFNCGVYSLKVINIVYSCIRVTRQ